MCDCIGNVDKFLSNVNTEVVVNMSDEKRVKLATQRVNRSRRKGPVSLYATYCPFCGQKYEIELEDTLDNEVERRR